MNDRIKIKYVNSSIGCSKKQKMAVRSLGFTRLNQVREYSDHPCLRGVVKKYPHLLKVVS